jgi:hypothetical protein
MQFFRKAQQAFILWLARRLPACNEITALTSQSIDRKISRRERMTLRLHFFVCLWCERYHKHLLFIKDALHHDPAQLEDGEASPTAFLSPEARERIKRSFTQN